MLLLVVVVHIKKLRLSGRGSLFLLLLLLLGRVVRPSLKLPCHMLVLLLWLHLGGGPESECNERRAASARDNNTSILVSRIRARTIPPQTKEARLRRGCFRPRVIRDRRMLARLIGRR